MPLAFERREVVLVVLRPVSAQRGQILEVGFVVGGPVLRVLGVVVVGGGVGVGIGSIGRLGGGGVGGAVEVRRAPLEPLQHLLGRRSGAPEPLAEVFPRGIEDGRDDGGHVRAFIPRGGIRTRGLRHDADLGALLLHRGGERAVELVDLLLKLGPRFAVLGVGRSVARLRVGRREHRALLRD